MVLRAGTYSYRVPFIWTDWAALFVGLAFLLFLLLLLMIDFIAAGSAGTSHLMHTLGTQAIEFNLLVAAIVWASLRGVDYIVRTLHRLASDGLKKVHRQATRVMRTETSTGDVAKASASR